MQPPNRLSTAGPGAASAPGCFAGAALRLLAHRSLVVEIRAAGQPAFGWFSTNLFTGAENIANDIGKRFGSWGVISELPLHWGRNRYFNHMGRLSELLATLFATPRGDRPLSHPDSHNLCAQIWAENGSFPLPWSVLSFLVLMIPPKCCAQTRAFTALSLDAGQEMGRGHWPSASNRPCSSTTSGFPQWGAGGMMKVPSPPPYGSLFSGRDYPPSKPAKSVTSSRSPPTPDKAASSLEICFGGAGTTNLAPCSSDGINPGWNGRPAEWVARTLAGQSGRPQTLRLFLCFVPLFFASILLFFFFSGPPRNSPTDPINIAPFILRGYSTWCSGGPPAGKFLTARRPPSTGDGMRDQIGNGPLARAGLPAQVFEVCLIAGGHVKGGEIEWPRVGRADRSLKHRAARRNRGQRAEAG